MNNSIVLYHNILWSKYKGGVFSQIHSISSTEDLTISIVQIAETELDRVGLSKVDLTYHKYPYELMFTGAYDLIPKYKRVVNLFLSVWRNSASMVLLPGFHKPEYWAMLLAAKIQRKVVGVFCDSTEFDRPRSYFKSFFKRFFFSNCDVFFGYGQRSHDYLAMNGAPRKYIYFRCQAAALPHDYDSARVLEERLNFFANADSPRFLYVGRISPEKGLDTLLRAFSRVLVDMPLALLVIVGSGPIEKELKSLAKALKISDHVEFAGAKDAAGLREEYLRATCLVLPSISEPWGLVVNEALAHGCPVVVSHRCGCVPELVIDGISGYVFKASDIDDLTSKMLRIVVDLKVSTVSINQCLEIISTFTPEAAARQIILGCKATLSRLRSHA